MPYKGDPIAEKLDKLAESTGFPQFSRKLEARMPMRLRALPLILLAVATAGMAVQIAGYGLVGYWGVLMAWIFTISLQQWGPLRQPRGRGYDEREAALVRNGHFTGMMWALGVAVLGSLTIALGKAGAMVRLWYLWAPETPMDWMAVTFFLLTVELNVAILAASSAMPEPLEDGEE
jgi:hypothetical protein